jgi:hypothetical protein
MNKKVVIILIVLLLLYFVTKAQKPTATDNTLPPPTPPSAATGTYSGRYAWGYYKVKAGDTLYKIAKANIPFDLAKKKYEGFKDGEGNPLDTEKNLVLMYAQQLAEANGFNWALFDSKPTSNLRDPDTLKPNQKLVVWSWDSFRANDDNGYLLPFEQYNAFGEWTPKADAEQHMKESFEKNPPRSL